MPLRRILLPFALLALAALHAEAAPTLRVEQEGERDFAIVAPGQWFDLLVTVDAQGMELEPDGLTLAASGEGVEFDAPLRLASGADDGRIVMRVPTRLPDGARRTIRLELRGEGFEPVVAEKELQAEAQATGHVRGNAALRHPAKVGVPNAVVLELNVLEGYHVYGTLGADEGLPLVARLVPGRGTPPGERWTGGGPVEAPGEHYEGGFTFEVPFTPVREGETKLRVLLLWQACTDMLCDPNEIAYLPLAFDVEAGEATEVVAPPAPAATEDQDGLATIGILELILLSIGAGLFALAMPCTYPLIPITISFFTKQAEVRHGRVMGLAMAYGAGIVAVFILIGLVIGAPIVEFATLWWVNAVFALLFLVFGLSLVGLFEIQPPAFMNRLATRASGTGGYLSVFAMGTTLVITSFTCTAPFIGSLLVIAGKGGDLGKVGFSMGVFGLTMAIPFVLLSLSPKALQNLPRSGEWMKTLKVTLGIVELGLVLKFVSNIDLAVGTFLIGRELFLALWGFSFLAAAAYLLAPLVRGIHGRWRTRIGVLMLAITGYLGSGLNGRPLWENLEAFLPILPETEGSYSEGFLKVVHEDYEEGLASAQQLRAPALVHFTGFQ